MPVLCSTPFGIIAHPVLYVRGLGPTSGKELMMDQLIARSIFSPATGFIQRGGGDAGARALYADRAADDETASSRAGFVY